jgi:hypothetical protein
VQAGGRADTQPNPLSPHWSKVPRVPKTKGRMSSVRCDETQRDCRAVLSPRPHKTALAKQCCILHSADSQAIEETTSRITDVQKQAMRAARLIAVMTGLIMQAKRGRDNSSAERQWRWRGETGCRAPRGALPTVVGGCQSTARVFLSFFLSFFFQPRPTRQKSGLATVLGEACGVEDSLAVGLGACLLELSLPLPRGRLTWFGMPTTILQVSTPC